MPKRILRPATISAAAALLIATVGLTACGSSSKTTSSSAGSGATTTPPASTSAASTKPGTVALTLNEYAIKSAPSSVTAGRVTFDVSNTGKLKHQLTVIRTTKPAATVLSKQKPNDDIPGAKGEIASLPPGASKKLVIKHLKPGHYALVCALPGHYQSGMHADFTVK